MKKIIKSITLFSMLFLLCGCAEDYAGITLPSGEDIIGKLIPNFWGFLIQLLAFVVMALIVIKFAYKPVSKFISKRQEYVANELLNAKNDRKEAETYLEESKNSIKESRMEANSIVEKAKTDALKVKEEILASAEEEIIARRKQAEEEILREKKQAEEDIRGDIIDVAFEATNALLQREVKDEDNKKFLDDFISSLDGE